MFSKNSRFYCTNKDPFISVEGPGSEYFKCKEKHNWYQE